MRTCPQQWRKKEESPCFTTNHFRIVSPPLWSWTLLERPPVIRSLDSFPAYYGKRMFITAFTRASTSPYPHLDQFSPNDPIISLQDPSQYYPPIYYSLVYFRYRDEQRGWTAEVQFPVEVKYLSLIHIVQTSSGTHPASYAINTRGYVLEVKQPQREDDFHVYIAPRSIPSCIFMAWCLIQ
jgi:hypothetical protein